MTTTLNRRNMLRGMAVSTAVATTVTGTAASAAREPAAIADQPIAALLTDLEKAISDRAAAIEAKEWKVAEYAHLWPLAPEEILYGINAWNIAPWRELAETNLAGEPIYRPLAEFSKSRRRLVEKVMGPSTERVNCAVETPERLRQFHRNVLNNARKYSGTSEKERQRRFSAAADLKRHAALSEQYHAETTRLRKVSGIDAILAARKDAEVRIENMLKTLSQTKARTRHGATMKARAIAMWQASCGSGDKVVDSIRTMAVAQSVVRQCHSGSDL